MAPHAMFKKRLASRSAPAPYIEDLSPSTIPIYGVSRFVVVIHNLLTPDECANLVRRAEDEGFDQALIQGVNGEQILRQDIRSCGRCIIDDVALADAVYQRILNAIGGTDIEKKVRVAPWMAKRSKSNLGGDYEAVGLNERMRFLRYQPGHFFAPHQDIRFTRGPEWGSKAGEISHITVQLYLNDKFKGGTTRFLHGKRQFDVHPKVGSALLFDHDMLHEGSKVLSGQKYSVRTDIMYYKVDEDDEEEDGVDNASIVTP